jgi:hypothetical protein
VFALNPIGSDGVISSASAPPTKAVPRELISLPNVFKGEKDSVTLLDDEPTFDLLKSEFDSPLDEGD